MSKKQGLGESIYTESYTWSMFKTSFRTVTLHRWAVEQKSS